MKFHPAVRWLSDPRFAELPPRDLFAKQVPPPGFPPHPEGLEAIHTFLRRSFTREEPPVSATLRITADDYAKCYLNGHLVFTGPAQQYPEHYYVLTLDVTGVLAAGENVLAAHVYYHGLKTRPYQSDDYRQGLLAELTLVYPGGRSEVIASDGQWRMLDCRAYPGEVMSDHHAQFIEHFDARQYPFGWRKAGFDDSTWQTPAVRCLAELDYHFVPAETPPVQVRKRRPEIFRRVEQGQYFIDFGGELTGQLELELAGPAGHVVEVHCGEELREDGSVRWDLRCGCTYREFWTLAGRGRERLEPFDYKGFRYAAVLNAPCELTADDVWAVERHHPWPADAAELETPDGMLQRIWDICAAGVRLGTQEHFVDCPQREKGQYHNDNVITGHSHLVLTADIAMQRKALRDCALSSRICPGLMSCAPGNYMQEIAEASLFWPMQLWRYYLHSADRSFLEEMRPVLEGLLAYFRRFENDSGLLEGLLEKWNLVDWPENVRDGYDVDLTAPQHITADKPGPRVCHNVLNAYYAGMLRCAGRILLALDEDDPPAARRAGEVAAAFRETFGDEGTGLFVDRVGSRHISLHGNAIALAMGLVEAENLPATVEFLRERGMACGVSVAYWLLRGLLDAGEADLAWQQMVRDPGTWPRMVREGATSCWEAWGAEVKWNTSFCHPWASAPVSVLAEGFLGVRPGRPGWREILVEPRLPRDVPAMRLRRPTPAGRLDIEIGREGESTTLTLLTPPGIEVIGPRAKFGGWKPTQQDTARGRYQWRRQG